MIRSVGGCLKGARACENYSFVLPAPQAALNLLRQKCTAVKSGIVDLKFYATKALLYEYTCVQLGCNPFPKGKAPATAAAAAGGVAPVTLGSGATMAQANMCLDKASMSSEN
eukprot:9485847-Pyramimonas_sp.AAC.1